MGDCTSRPTESEIEQHLSGSNAKNDQFFRSIPFPVHSEASILKENNINVLERKKKLFEKKKQEYTYKLESTIQGMPVIPELNIEVQKGVNFFNNQICVSQGQPFVSVSLEPNGPKFDTYVSDRYKPYWFRFIQFRQTLWSFKSVLFKVVMKNSMVSDAILGIHEIKINDLEDQMVHEGWFDLICESNNFEARPALRLRIQLIRDERALLENLMKSCEEKMSLIDKRIEKIHAINYNSD